MKMKPCPRSVPSSENMMGFCRICIEFCQVIVESIMIQCKVLFCSVEMQVLWRSKQAKQKLGRRYNFFGKAMLRCKKIVPFELFTYSDPLHIIMRDWSRI